LAEELFNHRANSLELGWQALSGALAIERGDENVGPISSAALSGLSKLNVPLNPWPRFPRACTAEMLGNADLVIAMKESEHRPLMEARFRAWADRVVYWHVDDLDVTTDFEATAMVVDGLIDRLILAIR
jgi:protein-tyrosine phosphatase